MTASLLAALSDASARDGDDCPIFFLSTSKQLEPRKLVIQG